ncbi:MAG: hypothetical protein H6987_18115 [Pseudomonadales bacterium]|nr:hypothetical protein [Halioglobus sp.]MCP5194976.1 hypothetical protein [Pseudomonadales bacterium]
MNKLAVICLASGCLFSLGSVAESTAITLGSTAAQVKSSYGQPLQDLGTIVKFQSCENPDSDARLAFVFVPPLPDAGDKDRAAGGKLTGVQRYACNAEILTDATVKAEAGNMVPPDTRTVREFTTEDGRKAWELQSELLAAMFAAGDFLGCDAQGNLTPVTPGTFSYTVAADGSSWFMGLGTCL